MTDILTECQATHTVLQKLGCFQKSEKGDETCSDWPVDRSVVESVQLT